KHWTIQFAAKNCLSIVLSDHLILLEKYKNSNLQKFRVGEFITPYCEKDPPEQLGRPIQTLKKYYQS
ncbi:hypothetical protein, partial [Bartonella sp. MR168JLCBS]|uniref:hypothetical protein n=1 Tax=Bartonella sp. MR168JLCBS TaxID=3243556 RepID=UPI0035D12BC1